MMRVSLTLQKPKKYKWIAKLTSCICSRDWQKMQQPQA
ncbi:MAG: hypothetical protein OFPI_25590 [Osedax symbiont Rs2]|nr:MAG: hypothetical protein OFPI_25590 [Osedax symbiont Rs2]